jgi:hypothetical protein
MAMFTLMTLKNYLLTGNFNKSLVGSAFFSREHKGGRVVAFSTIGHLEDQLNHTK